MQLSVPGRAQAMRPEFLSSSHFPRSFDDDAMHGENSMHDEQDDHGEAMKGN
jgi:hypothetical protein